MTTDERFEKLERELSAVRRRYRLVTLGMTACLAIMVAGWTLGLTATPADGQARVLDEIRARSFVLVDRDGTVRAILGSTEVDGFHSNSPRLEFFDEGTDHDDEGGNPDMVLDGSRVLFFNRADGGDISLSANSDNGAELRLSDSFGRPRVLLVQPSSPSEGPRLEFLDETGTPRVLSLTDTGLFR